MPPRLGRRRRRRYQKHSPITEIDQFYHTPSSQLTHVLISHALIVSPALQFYKASVCNVGRSDSPNKIIKIFQTRTTFQLLIQVILMRRGVMVAIRE